MATPCLQGLCHPSVKTLRCEAARAFPAAGRARAVGQDGREMSFWQAKTPPEREGRRYAYTAKPRQGL